MIGSYSDHMANEQLIDIMKKLLQTDSNLDFLSKLSKSEIETLIAGGAEPGEKIRRILTSNE